MWDSMAHKTHTHMINSIFISGKLFAHKYFIISDDVVVASQCFYQM